jgi:hypothetical protein
MNPLYKLFPFLLVFTLIVGCQKEPLGPANLVISDVHFTETYSSVYLDVLDGSYQPDNPNFHPNKPETWTGNMAQYVKHFRGYTATYNIENIGPGIAYDTEIDIIFIFKNGEEEIKTGKIGNLHPDRTYKSSASINSINNELEECYGEAYWFDE